MILAIVKNDNVSKAKERLDRPVFANAKYLSNADFKKAESVYFDNSAKELVEKFSSLEEFKNIKFVNIDDKPKDKTKNKDK